MTVKQICAVLMAVLLVGAGGSAVALSATDAGSHAVESTHQMLQQGNETDNGTVGNETGNVTDAADGVTPNATVTFRNQTTNGTFVTVQRTTLTEGGFVEVTNANGVSVGNSSYLQAGVHTDVRVNLTSPLATNQTLTAFVLRDSNANQQFDGVNAGNATDQPYLAPNGSVVTATAFVNVSDAVAEPTNATAGNATNATAGNATMGNATNATAGNATAGNATMGNATNVTAGNATMGNATAGDATNASASATFGNQTSNGTAVTVRQVRMADGGFVAIHEVTDGGAGAVIGASDYLEPGVHENVTVQLYGDVPGANFTETRLRASATLLAMPHRDTNANQSYDFLANASLDGPYVANGSAVTDTAFVAVSNATANATAGNATTGNATAGDATAGNATTNATAGNQSAVVRFDGDGEDNETDGNATDGDAATNETDGATSNETDGAATNETDGAATNETDGAATNETDGATDETGNETIDVVVVETERATLAVPVEQSGNGTTLAVTNASADARYYVEARYNDTLYNTTRAFEANETFAGNLTLRPELVNVTTVTFNVTVHEAAVNGSVLAQANTSYTLLEATAAAGNATTNATAGNATAGNATMNATAGNATAGNATDGNESGGDY